MSASFPERVEQLVEQAEQLDADAVRRVLALLEQLRERVNAQLAQRSDLTFSDTRRLKAEIEALIRQFEAALATSVSGYQEQAWNLADDVIDAELAVRGLRTGTVGISTETLRVVQGYSADQIKGLTADALKRINTELQLAALGGRSFTELVKNIGADLDGPSVFGTVATRAEMIARTEVSRAYSLGYQVRGNQVAETVPGTQKVWRHATGVIVPASAPKGVYRPRPTHVALDGTTIPWEDTFNVGGVKAHGPHDPRLPAKETIGCKCRLTLDFSAVEDETLRVA